MKKRYFLAASVLAIVALTGCGNTAEPISGTQDKSKLTLQQVFEKAIERQQNLKNVHVEIDVNQQTETPMEGEMVQFSTTSNLAMDVQHSPFAMFAKGTVAMEMLGEHEEIPLEMYMTEQDGFYLFNGTTKQWLKLPDEQYKQMIAQTGAQADPTEQLKQLQQFVEDFEFKQDDQNYLLTLNIEGEKFKEFIMEQLGSSLGVANEMNGDVLKTMTFEDSQYELVIAKDTFDTKEIEMDLTILMELNGQKMKIDSDAEAKYSRFDALDEIKIPNEVKNKAISE